MSERIRHPLFRDRVVSAETAAERIAPGMTVAMSGFTGAGYPKSLPTAIAEKAKEIHAQGEDFKIDVFTGASTAPDCDGVMAEANAINYRMPYQSDPSMRNSINAGEMKYQDIHLSHSGLQVEQGFHGELDVAVIEVTRITDDGHLIVPKDEDEEEDPRAQGMKDFKKVFINPVIEEETGDEWGFNEGCLSIPKIREEVFRKEKILVTYYDQNWELKEERFEGYAARIIQHEYDHIEGILFTDHLSILKKRLLTKKLQNISKGIVDVDYKMKFPVKKKQR